MLKKVLCLVVLLVTGLGSSAVKADTLLPISKPDIFADGFTITSSGLSHFAEGFSEELRNPSTLLTDAPLSNPADFLLNWKEDGAGHVLTANVLVKFGAAGTTWFKSGTYNNVSVGTNVDFVGVLKNLTTTQFLFKQATGLSAGVPSAGTLFAINLSPSAGVADAAVVAPLPGVTVAGSALFGGASLLGLRRRRSQVA